VGWRAARGCVGPDLVGVLVGMQHAGAAVLRCRRTGAFGDTGTGPPGAAAAVHAARPRAGGLRTRRLTQGRTLR